MDIARGDCFQCRSRKLLFSAARAIGPYEGALRQAVLKAKHAAYEPLAKALGLVLAAQIQESPFGEPPDAVTAVPMHWLKRVWRNTNPEETICRAVAIQLGLENLSGALVCRRYLQRQSSLNPADRRKNVRGAFCAARFARIAGKRILLIDDVMTTGATAHECSRALLEAGASRVFVATVARASADF
jgi:ComF family protein